MTSKDSKREPDIPVFRIDEDGTLDLASLLEDDSASTATPGASSDAAFARKTAEQTASLNETASKAANEAIAANLNAGGFDQDISALIYGPDTTEPEQVAESAVPTLNEPNDDAADSTAGNVFKVDLDGLDDFEALLQRTMGEAAGIAPNVAVAPEAADATVKKPAGPQQPPPTQWRKPERTAKSRERDTEAESGESKAVDELRKKVKAMSAETASYRGRLEEEAKAARGKGREDVFKSLMPIVDALEMALKSAGDTQDTKQLTQGIELVLKRLYTDLGLLGLETISPEGETFDPTIHEAFQQVTTGTVEPGTVAEVVRKGFRVKERLLRPAQVLVEKA